MPAGQSIYSPTIASQSIHAPGWHQPGCQHSHNLVNWLTVSALRGQEPLWHGLLAIPSEVCNFEKNRVVSLQGSTPIDLAEPDMVKMLEELKKRQNDKPKINAVSLKTLPPGSISYCLSHQASKKKMLPSWITTEVKATGPFIRNKNQTGFYWKVDVSA